MAKNNNTLSAEKVYDLINTMRVELNERIEKVSGNVQSLNTSFNNLEAGRVSAVEKEVAIIRASVDSMKENSKPLTNLFWEIIKYVIIAVVAALLALVIKSNT